MKGIADGTARLNQIPILPVAGSATGNDFSSPPVYDERPFPIALYSALTRTGRDGQQTTAAGATTPAQLLILTYIYMRQTKPRQPTAVIGLVGERTWTLGYQGDRRRGDSGYGLAAGTGRRQCYLQPTKTRLPQPGPTHELTTPPMIPQHPPSYQPTEF